jgi:hypothetical protein
MRACNLACTAGRAHAVLLAARSNVCWRLLVRDDDVVRTRAGRASCSHSIDPCIDMDTLNYLARRRRTELTIDYAYIKDIVTCTRVERVRTLAPS